MPTCKRCNEFIFSDKCNCKQFSITDEDGDNYEIHAMSEEDAALKYAQTSNCENDHYLMDNSVVITINKKQFKISAEADVFYSANEI